MRIRCVFSSSDGVTEVLQELIEEAILTTERNLHHFDEGIYILADKMKQTTDPELLQPFMHLLPVCQRISDDPKYHSLFLDPQVVTFIQKEIYRTKKEPSA